MDRLQQVVHVLDAAIGGPDVNIGTHRAFWRGLTRDEFVSLKVFGLDVISVGDGAASNLVKALRGDAPFGADRRPGDGRRRVGEPDRAGESGALLLRPGRRAGRADD